MNENKFLVNINVCIMDIRKSSLVWVGEVNRINTRSNGRVECDIHGSIVKVPLRSRWNKKKFALQYQRSLGVVNEQL